MLVRGELTEQAAGPMLFCYLSLADCRASKCELCGCARSSACEQSERALSVTSFTPAPAGELGLALAEAPASAGLRDLAFASYRSRPEPEEAAATAGTRMDSGLAVPAILLLATLALPARPRLARLLGTGGLKASPTILRREP